MSESKTNVSMGTSPAFLLLLLFVGLKLTGFIDWSWWWVTSPLWLPICVLAVLAGGIGLFAALKK